MLAVYIQYKVLFQNNPNPVPKGFTETFQLTCQHMFFLIVGRIYPIQIYILLYLYLYSDLRNTCQLYLYIGIGYIIPTIGSVRGFCAPRNVHLVIYIFALDICCQHLGNIVSWRVSVRKVKECTCCNICVSIHIFLLDICCQNLEVICQ